MREKPESPVSHVPKATQRLVILCQLSLGSSRSVSKSGGENQIKNSPDHFFKPKTKHWSKKDKSRGADRDEPKTLVLISDVHQIGAGDRN